MNTYKTLQNVTTSNKNILAFCIKNRGADSAIQTTYLQHFHGWMTVKYINTIDHCKAFSVSLGINYYPSLNKALG